MIPPQVNGATPSPFDGSDSSIGFPMIPPQVNGATTLDGDLLETGHAVSNDSAPS